MTFAVKVTRERVFKVEAPIGGVRHSGLNVTSVLLLWSL